MRTLLTQDHPTIVRDFILNYKLDRPDSRIIDFTAGKKGFWKTDYKYQLEVVCCDAEPLPDYPDIIKKNLLTDDYADLGMFDAGVFDPPYIIKANKRKVFNYESPTSMQKQGKNSWGTNPQFTENKTSQVFIERVQGLNRAALQCIKPGGFLFVKVMDVRDKGWLVPNHLYVCQNLSGFKYYATFIYYAGGAKTWKGHAESAHGYWLVFRRLEKT